MPQAGFTSFRESKTTRKILRVNNFAIFCELDRALTPVAPRVSLGRRPLCSASVFACPWTPWWSSTSRTGTRSTASMRRRSLSASPRTVQALSAPSIHTSCSRTPSSKTPPTAAIGCKVLRLCPGSQGESGPRARFFFCRGKPWRTAGVIHRARKRRSGNCGGSDPILGRAIWWILGGPLLSLQLSRWELAFRAIILLR